MSFTSGVFILFFTAVLAVYWLLPERRWKNLFLLAASYLFYGWVNPWYVLLLAFSTAGDYFLVLGMLRNPGRAKGYFSSSLVLNLLPLGFFKYFNFLSSSAAGVLSSLGLGLDAPVLSLALPLGISFFTLKKLSYMIEVRRGTFQPVRSLVDFALYVAFFPQLVAGPIDRPRQLLPQIQSDRRWQAENFNNAWPLLVMGFFKKLVIANTISVMVDKIFILALPGKLLLFAGGLAFTLQVLADFSAYTDISRGAASLLGFKTSPNFNAPYFSLTPTDFWNRWHITLSTWLRDYIFYPLNYRHRHKKQRLFWAGLAVIVTFLVSGLWHGANWTFVLWGLYYGVLIVIYQALGMGASWKPKHIWQRVPAWLVMFTLIVLGWILFRTPSLAWLGGIIASAPLSNSPEELIVALVVISNTAFFGGLMFIPHLLANLRLRWRWLEALYLAAALVMVVIYINSSSPDFIYFQF